MRRAWALARVVVLRHSRSPVLLGAAAVFAAIAAATPLPEGSFEARARAAAGLHAAIGGAVLLVLAAFVPLASQRLRRAGAPGGLGRAGTQGACLAGHGLVLLLAAVLISAASLAVLAAKVGWPDGRGRGAIVRRALARGPASGLELSEEAREVRLLLPFDGLAAEYPELRLRLAPRWRIVPGAITGADSPLRYHLDVRARAAGRPEWTVETLVFSGRGAREMRVALPRGLGAGVLEVVLEKRSGAHRLTFDEDGVLLLGAREAFVAVAFRGFLLSACGALSLMGLTVWLTGFVAGPIAVAAAATAVLAGLAGARWLPGAPLADPAAAIADGVALGWPDLAPSALKALAWAMGAMLFAARDPRADRRS